VLRYAYRKGHFQQVPVHLVFPVETTLSKQESVDVEGKEPVKNVHWSTQPGERPSCEIG